MILRGAWSSVGALYCDLAGFINIHCHLSLAYGQDLLNDGICRVELVSFLCISHRNLKVTATHAYQR